MVHRIVKHVETEKFDVEPSKAKLMRLNMPDAVVISGFHDKKETYQLVLRGEWFSRAYAGPMGTRHYFLDQTSREFADIICEKNVGYKMGFKDGVLIVDGKRLDVSKVGNDDLERKLTAELRRPRRRPESTRELFFPNKGEVK